MVPALSAGGHSFPVAAGPNLLHQPQRKGQHARNMRIARGVSFKEMTDQEGMTDHEGMIGLRGKVSFFVGFLPYMLASVLAVHWNSATK